MSFDKQELEDRIKEIAIKYCGDYPDLEKVQPFEHLWAIECTLNGIGLANEDCHRFIKHLGSKLGLNTEELYDEWVKFKQKEIAEWNGLKKQSNN